MKRSNQSKPRHRTEQGEQPPAQQAQAAWLKEAAKQQDAAKNTQGGAPQASAEQEPTSWHKHTDSKSPRPSTNVSTRQEGDESTAVQTKACEAPSNSEARSQAGRRSCNHHNRRPKMEEQQRMQIFDTPDAPPFPGARMLNTPLRKRHTGTS